MYASTKWIGSDKSKNDFPENCNRLDMIDPNLPPIEKYVVVDKSNCVKLITSNRTIAKWYQGLFDIGKLKDIKIFLK